MQPLEVSAYRLKFMTSYSGDFSKLSKEDKRVILRREGITLDQYNKRKQSEKSKAKQAEKVAIMQASLAKWRATRSK